MDWKFASVLRSVYSSMVRAQLSTERILLIREFCSNESSRDLDKGRS